ncbi:response regulator [Gimesia benthica]|uniref:Response regulator n=1 Tax=Gimesia benthica TaxID=2608982 RepID=A0A6I6AIN4_9PLAN|nr:response regulator [Gimesia benthica]QGQ26317.1 response regulator [Gimesia benthica]
MKILIVDEIGFIRQSLNQKLSRHNFDTVSAESGEEALTILKTDFSVDAVLTSLFLPSMNAIDLYKAASKIERFNDEGIIPPLNFFLMVTREHGTSSPRMKEMTRDALAIGFKDLLIKPIDTELLVNKLRGSMRSSEPPPEIEEPEPVVAASTTEEIQQSTQRIDGLAVMQNSLHALKKEMCESIDILLEEVNRKVSK